MEILITTHFVKDFDLGANGNLYGGRMLDWLDEAGALFVHGVFDEYFVTWKIGETFFLHPVKAKSIVKFYVKNVDLRSSSVGFDLVVKCCNIPVVSTSMVFVCVDQKTGEKKEISLPRDESAGRMLNLCLVKYHGKDVNYPDTAEQ